MNNEKTESYKSEATIGEVLRLKQVVAEAG